jgi:hypothetical protein
MKRLLLLASALAVSSPAMAKTHVSFAAYEGTGSDVITGKGGTRKEAHGVDFWTTGDPPRPFHYLGVLKVIGGDPVGSKAVAEAIKKAGGNAAVLKKSDTQAFAVHKDAVNIPQFGVTMPSSNHLMHETISVLAVIRYAD